MKYKKERPELDTWKPLADIFSGLMLMFLLILMLIILFIGYKDGIYNETGDGDDDGGHIDYVERDDHDDDDGGGGGGYEDPRDDVSGDDGLAAIKVVVVDADTGKVIKHEGIEFDLFLGYRGENLSLYTYYPHKQEYTMFETVSDGTFFLPEKVQQNTYVLKNISAPAGYISGESMAFTVSDSYYWDDPLVVRFALSTKKHSFDIYVTDSKTGDPVPNGVYNVTTTGGKVVGEIVCDANGYGQSEMLPVNTTYLITQSTPNDFYAVPDVPISVTVKENTDEVVNIQAVKTTFKVTINDELKKTPIAGVKLAVYGNNNTLLGEYTTNAVGVVELQNLHAGETYTVVQTAWAENWKQDPYQTKFSVDTKGRIEGYSVYSVSGTNRMIRVNIAAKERIFGFAVSGEPMILRDESGNVIKQWNAEKNGTVIEGLAPGRYTLEIEGKAPIDIEVSDAAEIQHFYYRVLNPFVLAAVIATGIILLVCIVLLTAGIVKKRKSTEKEEKTDESEGDR